MAHLTPAHIQHLYETFGELRVLDDIIRHRAKDNPPAPILGYPKIEDDVNVYESFTGQQLDVYVDRAVKYFLEQGLKPVSLSEQPSCNSPVLMNGNRIKKESLVSTLHPTSTSSLPSSPSVVSATLSCAFPLG
jgi:hypothetical protein